MSFFRNKAGSIAPIAALLTPLVLSAGGLSIDYAFMRHKKAELQHAADVAAVAATRELSIALNKTDHIDAVVKNFVYSAVKSKSGITVASNVSQGKNTVAVKISLDWKPFFAQYFDSDVTPLVVNAKATIAGHSKICVLGLLPDFLAGVHLDDKSKMEAGQCGVYSNSVSANSIRVDKGAKAKASVFCAAGGVKHLSKLKLEPKPVTNCPVIPDPLMNREKPTVGACNWTNRVVSTNAQLKPGVYCGGLTLEGNAIVKLDPGIFIIKDGPLVVKDNASLTTTGSGFFLTGKDSLIDFHKGSHINLRAPTSGLLAGLLFYEDRDVYSNFKFEEKKVKDLLKLNKRPAGVRVHIISSNDARQLLGTIYLPRGILLVNAHKKVAHESAYTAIVVARLWLQKGPILVLNSDYSVTDVPVPAGIDGGRSRLIE